ncbi:hemerythrin [Leptospira perolatii]|uniref:Hemerythrin n=2 Tax=Leptospira perolatii TaxID=2023191 RepID=A0A2M9ZRB2_9LEPT|nr:hemerythrin [Leptospira perolatii]PJZ74473.1 hemerythrin [Leptospira perolatii]
MALNIPVIDKQHIWLIAMIVELEEDIESETPYRLEENFSRSLTKALDYTLEHFSLEEKALELMNYPKLGQHRVQHMRFIGVLRRRARERMAGDYRKASLNLLRNMRTWLYQHILSEDRAYLDAFTLNYEKVKDAIELQFNTSPHREEVEELYNIITYSPVSVEPEDLPTLDDDNLKLISELWHRYRLKTGIAIVDMQHLWLLKLLVKLEKMHKQRLKQQIGSDEVSPKIKEALAATVDYIREHFATEEAIMRQFHFHGTMTHLKQHRGFDRLISELVLHGGENDFDAVSKLLQDLKEWLISHIAVEDKKLFYFFRYRLGEVNDYVRKLNQEGRIHIWKDAVHIYRLLVNYEEVSGAKV